LSKPRKWIKIMMLGFKYLSNKGKEK